MHLPQEMTAAMRDLDLTANAEKLHLLGQQGRVKGHPFTLPIIPSWIQSRAGPGTDMKDYWAPG